LDIGLANHSFHQGACPVSNKRVPNEREVIGLLGVGLDNKDGHQRLTRGEHFFLVGGSQETHEHMQDAAIRLTKALERRGKRLPDASVNELIDLLHESTDE
jgi:hypothetical protein